MKKFFVLFCLCFFLASCSHKPARVTVAPAPPVDQPEQQVPEGTPPEVTAEKPESLPESSPSPEAEIQVDRDNKPVEVETGIASWYGAPYHNRRGSNGEVYDMNAMTAAHRTLPLGSIVRVTNLDSRKSAMVRITDRGPFIEGRIIDLSQAAAKQIGLVQKGTGRVRVEVLTTPQPIESGGRWAVQLGGFERENRAREIADHLTHRYHSAKVLTFSSPTGAWWVRVRVKDDLRARAEEITRDTKTPEGGVFLVRLD
jgi:rare lipoprotein A